MTTHDELINRLQEYADEDRDLGWNTNRARAHLDAKAAIEQLQRDLAALMADKEEEVRLHRAMPDDWRLEPQGTNGRLALINSAGQWRIFGRNMGDDFMFGFLSALAALAQREG
jgi:hypothetical protein